MSAAEWQWGDHVMPDSAAPLNRIRVALNKLFPPNGLASVQVMRQGWVDAD